MSTPLCIPFDIRCADFLTTYVNREQGEVNTAGDVQSMNENPLDMF